MEAEALENAKSQKTIKKIEITPPQSTISVSHSQNTGKFLRKLYSSKSDIKKGFFITRNIKNA
ncbi:MAG: hypothetical protein KatS3mg035_1277 [Bacteroidia bacterium]|nr:MAG: hypothetical protein KatS3mg035_1277 [Bacteroidia bacterium]